MRYLILLLLLPMVMGAQITGQIYDYSLDPLNDVIVTIDTEPKQQQIAKDGSYSFTVDPGTYTLRASYSSDARYLLFEERVTVSGEGEYVYDIIMFPSLAQEQELADIVISVPDVDEQGRTWIFYVGFVLALAVAFLAWWLWPKKNEEHDDKTYSEVLSLIKKRKRLTQKEIRCEVPMSEAKISLVLAELEDKGVIRKIKKGRGNIIVLK